MIRGTRGYGYLLAGLVLVLAGLGLVAATAPARAAEARNVQVAVGPDLLPPLDDEPGGDKGRS
jgi:hypothetical protein